MQFFPPILYMPVKFGQEINTFNKKKFKLQNRALRIISFSEFHTNSNPLYANLRILKLTDQIVLQNCLFVHDALNKVSPLCFHIYFSQVKDIHSISTKSAVLGCLYVTTRGTIKYGLNSITNKCISNWNEITNTFNYELLTLSRYKLKSNIKLYFTQSYT
jgi:hypothetical protein